MTVTVTVTVVDAVLIVGCWFRALCAVCAVCCVVCCVQVTVDVSFALPNGVNSLLIRLYSPSGTAVELAVPTTTSSPAQTSLTAYPLSARAFWGESSLGTWMLSVSAPGTSGTGSFTKWQISVAGTVAPALNGAPSTAALSASVLFALAAATVLAAARLH